MAEIPCENWCCDYGYDFDLDSDLVWNLDRTAAYLKVHGLNDGEDVTITFWATASGWRELKALFDSDDAEAIWDWMDDHIEEVEA